MATMTEARWHLSEVYSVAKGIDVPVAIRVSQDLRYAAYDCATGERITAGDDWLTAPSDEQLADWDATAKRIAARGLHDGSARWIRFGRLPKGGRSRNHATGQLEAGVSCYQAEYDPRSDAWQLAGGGLPAAAVAGALGMYGGVSLLLDGEHVGAGSDGEPVLQSPKVAARLRWSDEACGFVCD